jgi:hypothetical protein
LAIGVDIALFPFLLIRLPKVATALRQVLKGALLFAVVVGLLIWINYLSRFTLFVALGP